MSYEEVSSGKELPNDINVIIEIPLNGDPIKYEVDKDSGEIFVDRMLGTAMYLTHFVAMATQWMSW